MNLCQQILPACKALTERRYIFLSRGGLAQRAPLQTQLARTISPSACAVCQRGGIERIDLREYGFAAAPLRIVQQGGVCFTGQEDGPDVRRVLFLTGRQQARAVRRDSVVIRPCSTSTGVPEAAAASAPETFAAVPKRSC